MTQKHQKSTEEWLKREPTLNLPVNNLDCVNIQQLKNHIEEKNFIKPEDTEQLDGAELQEVLHFFWLKELKGEARQFFNVKHISSVSNCTT